MRFYEVLIQIMGKSTLVQVLHAHIGRENAA
jgi:hypothetical protein